MAQAADGGFSRRFDGTHAVIFGEPSDASSPPGLEIRVFDADTAFRWVDEHRNRTRGLWWVIPGLVLGGALASLLQGTLADGTSWSVLSRDFLDLAGRGPSQTADPSIPFLRDYSTILMLLLVGLFLNILHWQWRQMGTLLSRLHARGLMRFDKRGQEPSAVSIIEYGNRAFSAIGGNISLLIIVAAFACSIALFFYSSSTGIYASLAPDGGANATSPWTAAAYDSWWAGLRAETWIGSLYYLFAAALAIYYIFKQNLVGLIFTGMFLALGRHIRLVASPVNFDGYYGWRALRELLQTVSASILTHMLMIVALFLLVPIRGAYWATPVLVIFVVLNPLYVLVATVLYRHLVKTYRDTELLRLRAFWGARVAVATEDWVIENDDLVDFVRRQTDYVRGVPTRLFKMREVVGFVLISLVPALILYVQIALPVT